MIPLETSKLEFSNQNLPFYLNDYDETQTNFICLRLKGYLNYNNIISSDFSQTEQQLESQFEKISNDLQKIHFFIRSSNLIIQNKTNIKLLNKKMNKCSEIFEDYFQQPYDPKSFSVKNNLIKYIPVELLRTVTASIDRKENYSPLFTNHKGICRLETFNIPIDCLVLVNPHVDINNLYEILLEKLNLHLQTIKQCYANFHLNENNFQTETFHFLIENCQNSTSLIITTIYPSNQPDSKLVQMRKEIHKILELPLDRPYLRRNWAFEFKENVTQISDLESRYLINPHLSAKPSNLNGKQSIVFGNYIYFHYMQDGINDNGWGCAYRSFQTIFSWFKLQSYTQKPIPNHRDIQKSLVDIGDKSKEFIGSSKWIGCMEISFCLNSMLDIDCKIISVSKGSELVEKARELQFHFETEGTPVMIGGGVLAHTIIGIDFNELIGDVKFLILDPHFNGTEDIKTIISKGWIGWKDSKFWNENSYYNLCCPIRPKEV